MAMNLGSKSNFSKLFSRMDQLRESANQDQWVRSSADEFEASLRRNLAAQKGGLSSATLRIYALRGTPKGDGIRKHISQHELRSPGRYSVTVGIAKGNPTMVARVQEFGTTIRVTPKMRRWFSRHGIRLRSQTVFIRIPGRRFWSKAWKQARKNALRSIRENLCS